MNAEQREQRLKELDQKMNQLREELAGVEIISKNDKDFEQYYEKNLELDQIIEEYLDLKEQSTTSHHNS